MDEGVLLYQMCARLRRPPLVNSITGLGAVRDILAGAKQQGDDMVFSAATAALLSCLVCMNGAALQPQQKEPADIAEPAQNLVEEMPYQLRAEPPPINNVRYTEDYGYLRHRDAAVASLYPWAPLKYIPLGESDDVYLTLGAEFRLRYERFDDNNWGEGAQDDDGYLWARALPLADLHVGQNLRVFGQIISAFVYDLDIEKSPVDEDQLDLLQGFAEVRLPLGEQDRQALTFRLGRQLMTYGSGRLIDLRYGPNVLQSFDAAKAFIDSDRWSLDIFYALPVDHRVGLFDDRIDDHQSVWSLYGTLKGDPLGIDLYYIGYLNDRAIFSKWNGRELRHTLGARLFGESQAWDWNFELFYQFGYFNPPGATGDIVAWSVASDTGYTFEQAPLAPRLALRANIISGDRDSEDPDVQTFNPLFPKGKYFGELSPIGPSNLIHLNPYGVLHLSKQLQLVANLAFYWRQSDEDGVYALGGMDLLRTGNESASRYIGTQAELLLELQMNRHMSISGSYSIFTAGGFIDDTGSDETIHFVGLEWLYRL